MKITCDHCGQHIDVDAPAGATFACPNPECAQPIKIKRPEGFTMGRTQPEPIKPKAGTNNTLMLAVIIFGVLVGAFVIIGLVFAGNKSGDIWPVVAGVALFIVGAVWLVLSFLIPFFIYDIRNSLRKIEEHTRGRG